MAAIEKTLEQSRRNAWARPLADLGGGEATGAPSDAIQAPGSRSDQTRFFPSEVAIGSEIHDVGKSTGRRRTGHCAGGRHSGGLMKVGSRAAHWIVLAGLLVHCGVLAVADTFAASQAASATKLILGGKVYLHRWSKGGQHEFTPEGDEDLSRWRDMVTVNTHDAVSNGEQLAALANSVLSNYQRHGKIVRTDSKPRTPQRPAEHLIVAILGNPEFLEAVFTRIVLVDGVGAAAVYSHRVYGKEAARLMGEWLKTNGASIEKTLMAWDRIPTPAALRSLPQSK